MPVLVPPFESWIGLVDSTTGVEVTVVGYARVPVWFYTCVDGVTLANLTTVQWPLATADWGTIEQIQLWNALTGGDVFGTVPTTMPVMVSRYSRPRIQAAGLAVQQLPQPRGYGTLGYGTDAYGSYIGLVPFEDAVLDLTFGQPSHACETGAWTTPGPFALAA
jgi:hypothetical protein